MSLILDALNKADRQRDEQLPVPNLASYHHGPSSAKNEPKAVSPWAIYTVIGLLALVVFALFLLLFKGNNAPQGIKPDQLSQQPYGTLYDQESHLDVSLQPKLSSSQSVKEDSYMPLASDEVAEIYKRIGDELESHPSVEMNVQKQANPLPSRSQLAKQQKPVADLYANKANKSPVNVKKTSSLAKTEQSLPASDELQAMWEATKQQADGVPPQITPSDPYKSIPYLHQLPESFKDRIPTVKYENHIYSPKGGAVILNGRTYRAGDSLAQDLVIDAITQEDLVLSYMQKPFKLAALSSWIQAQ